MLVFAAALFLSSVLLFVLEPMFTKMVLPLLGSSPAVWNTAVLFFQAALLAGYAYAHATTRWLGSRRQSAVHSVILLVPLLVLPIGIPVGWDPPATGSPVTWLLLVLLVAVGLPFAVVATTAPLLQRWFASTGHRRASDPYFLYRASNLGSAAGLIAYPLLIEPLLPLDAQARLWTIGYGIFIAFSFAAAIVLWLGRDPGSATRRGAAPVAGGSSDTTTITLNRRLKWVALAFIPSSLLLGVTSYLTTNIAPVPLLWVVPLALYLLSFVLVFSPRANDTIRLAGRALPLVALPVVLTIALEAGHPLWLIALIHLVGFFVAAVVCHGELARDRPPASHLTEFYIWIATGGVLGGLFNAIIAPVLFDSFAEYPLAIVMALLVRPRFGPTPRPARQRVLDVALPVGLGVFILVVGTLVGDPAQRASLAQRTLVFGLPALACVAFLTRPIRFALGAGAILLATSLVGSLQSNILHSERTFFGVHRVETSESGRFRLLRHGTTIHGAQRTDAAGRKEPLTYYTAEGPLGQVFEAFHASAGPRSVGVVGMGTGSMACFARPGEEWTFFEIDPEVVRMATDPTLFTFLRDCLPSSEVVIGDGRLSLAEASPRRFGLLAVDAFNSDAIPTHLLTREALRVYLGRLGEGGLLAFHISNDFADLHPVLANLAADAGLVAYSRDEDRVSSARRDAGALPSNWVVLARRPADLGVIAEDPRWRPMERQPGFPVWTDDFSNLFSVLSFG